MDHCQHAASLYREVQRFNQKWLWVLLLVTDLALLVVFSHALVTQLALGQPWGNRPMSDTGLIITSAVSVFIPLGITYLLYKLKLITEVSPEGICLQFVPFRTKKLKFSEIRSCRARTYQPIREYGGWGMRYGRNGKAYNVSGNKGVQLELHQAKPLLIGSQRAEELAGVINARL